MHLKAVEMENFKSFGGKLVVPLMEGYTAVTGPNGSGKSNITDAILFVLGPKSSKAVRAGKLTDLIFDGGKSKGKASFTKVSLVFDNTDRLMPWDDDTVRLTRYVKLSDNGTDYSSYFYVNDRKSTMTEFDSLLTKARISADGYNLVQQGDVTRIVQMGAIERRRIIDAISGIASFDADIEKARTERQEAETNLDRIGIVVEELTHQVDRLARDREDARAYLEAQAALEMAKAQYSHRKLQMEQAKQQGVADQMSKLESRIDSDRAAKAELESQRADREAQISEKEEEIASKVGPEYRELKAKIEQAKIDLATRKDRREAAEADMEEQNGFKASFEESISRNNAEVVMLRQNREDLLVKMAEAESRMEAARKEEAEVSAAIADTGGEQKELQSELERVEADFDACSAELRSSQGRLAKAEAASEEAHTAFANLDERIQSIDFEIKDAKWSLEQVKAEAGPSTEDFGNRILDAKRRESELEKQETELVSAYRRIDAEYNALQAEKKVSERMNRGSAAVEAILSLRNRGEMRGIHGTIQELATVDKGFETALSVAAGGKMQAVVVDNDQVAADAIAYLKKEKLGRVTFLPLTKMMGGKPRAKAIMGHGHCPPHHGRDQDRHHGRGAHRGLRSHGRRKPEPAEHAEVRRSLRGQARRGGREAQEGGGRPGGRPSEAQAGARRDPRHRRRDEEGVRVGHGAEGADGPAQGQGRRAREDALLRIRGDEGRKTEGVGCRHGARIRQDGVRGRLREAVRAHGLEGEDQVPHG